MDKIFERRSIEIPLISAEYIFRKRVTKEFIFVLIGVGATIRFFFEGNVLESKKSHRTYFAFKVRTYVKNV